MAAGAAWCALALCALVVGLPAASARTPRPASPVGVVAAPAAPRLASRRARVAAAAPAEPGARSEIDDDCFRYPAWPALPPADAEPEEVMREMVRMLLSVPTPVIGQTAAYDFLAAAEVSTGLEEWREDAWAWRDHVASTILAPYDELDAQARREASADPAACTMLDAKPVASVRATLRAVSALLAGVRTRHAKLYACAKFVPKKNGLNPMLKRLEKGDADLGLDSMPPRPFGWLARDARRCFNQLFVLLVAYLTLPRQMSSDLLWATRLVVEKVKTDQRTRALEVLAAGAYARSSPLFELVECVDIRAAFEDAAGVAAEQFAAARGGGAGGPAAADDVQLRAYERMRMVYPYLQIAYLAAQTQQPPDDGGLARGHAAAIEAAAAALRAAEDAPAGARAAAAEPGEADAGAAAAHAAEAEDDDDDELEAPLDLDVSGVPLLLCALAEASPAEKTVSSLLYWMLDLLFKRALASRAAQGLPRTQFLVHKATTRAYMWATIADVGRLVGSMVGLSRAGLQGQQLLGAVKCIQAQTTLLQSLRDATSAGLYSRTGRVSAQVRAQLVRHDAVLAAAARTRLRAIPPSLVQQGAHAALGVLLGAPADEIGSRAAEVNEAMLRWRNPELLFRYYEDNLADPEMAPVVQRWLRSLFGCSEESTQDIRRRDAANARHLAAIDAAVLGRWYHPDCPGSNSARTLFMVGEDAGSCLRITSTMGNKFNKALMGYALQSHVRALIVTDEAAGTVLARSLIRLLVRSDSRQPVIYCDALFFTSGGYRQPLWAEIMRQAEALKAHMGIPVVHACSTLPRHPIDETRGGYVRAVKRLGYDVAWVDLLELDGVAPYTYSEDLPWDEMLDQHRPGLLHRTAEQRTLTVATLPLDDSPSAREYVNELYGKSMWTRGEADEQRPAAQPAAAR